MKHYKVFLLLFVVASFSFTNLHKYYFSVTDVEFVKDQQSVQIITRLFIDDFEKVLQQRYDEKIILDESDSLDEFDNYIGTYLTQKINISINNQKVSLKYLGKKYDDDLIICFIEIENITSIKQFEITDEVLFDMFEDQQNMIKTNINSIYKNFLLIKENHKGKISY